MTDDRAGAAAAGARGSPWGAVSARVTGGIHELEGDLSSSPLWNRDIAPARLAERKWGMWDIAALWIGMSVCIPTYTLASSLITGGMNWWQALLTILLGNMIVLVPMVLNAHAGTKYGIPFPVYCRASFGTLGANVPAMMRALVACGWFGIQTWIGGECIYRLLGVYFTGWGAMDKWVLGISVPQFACFMLFWAVNMAVVWRGMESIRWMEDWAAPLLIVIGLALLGWAWWRAGGFGPMLSQPSKFVAGGAKEGRFWTVFFPSLTAMVGFWATLSLNIPDFTRFARTQRDQVLGQALGLPTTMTLYSFIGVAVTSATVIIFGEEVWNPVDLLARFDNPLVIAVSMLGLTVATLSTNLAANVVGPANDISNLCPSKISFRAGGMATGVIGIVMMPWKLASDPSGYIYTWLIGYSALLGSIGGVLLSDYLLIRKTALSLPDLYRPDGAYRHLGGFNPNALIALALGIAPCVPGFLDTIGVAPAPHCLKTFYSYAWFVGFAVSFLVYGALSHLPWGSGRPEPGAP